MADPQRIIEWLISRDTGTSSMTIVAAMTGAPMDRPSVPHDASDFGRCYRLLQRFPEWHPLLDLVAKTYPEWVGMVREWDALTTLYEAGRLDKLYEALRPLIDEGRLASGWVKTGEGSWRRETKGSVEHIETFASIGDLAKAAKAAKAASKKAR